MKIPNNLAVIPNNPTPGIHYTPIEGGTTAKPLLTDLTYGAEGDSRIFHAHEKVLEKSIFSFIFFCSTFFHFVLSCFIFSFFIFFLFTFLIFSFQKS